MGKLLLNTLAVIILLISCSDDKPDQHMFDFKEKKDGSELPLADKFYFVGETELNPGVYRYNFKTKKSNLIWNSRTEKVIDLVSYSDLEKTFFITAFRYGMAGSFPFVEDAKLYRINPESGRGEFIKDLGDAIQIYCYWTDEANFNIVINSFDPKVNTYVIQNYQLYNEFGKLLSDRSETSDLFISGYPKFVMKEKTTDSPDNRFRVFNIGDSVFIRDKNTGTKNFIKLTNHSLNEVKWIEERSLVIFSTIDTSSPDKTRVPETGSLNIFDLSKMQLVSSDSGKSLYRFALTGEFLIFDSGLEWNSKIGIISLNNLEYYDTINIKGGCGLRNIPQIPFL